VKADERRAQDLSGGGFILISAGEILNASFIRRRKEGKEGSVFFSVEKKQKTFANSGGGASG